jgi:chromosome segregation ATPase
MNKTVTVGTLAIILLLIGFLSTSAFAVNYYQVATQATVRATTLEAKGKELSTQLAQTNSQLAQANRTLQETRAQLQDALARLGMTQEQLKATQGQLGTTQGQLKTTRTQLSQVQQENQRRLQMIFSQQENVKILKTCLAATVLSQHYYTKGIDHYVEWNKKPNEYD